MNKCARDILYGLMATTAERLSRRLGVHWYSLLPITYRSNSILIFLRRYWSHRSLENVFQRFRKSHDETVRYSKNDGTTIEHIFLYRVRGRSYSMTSTASHTRITAEGLGLTVPDQSLVWNTLWKTWKISNMRPTCRSMETFKAIISWNLMGCTNFACNALSKALEQ